LLSKRSKLTHQFTTKSRDITERTARCRCKFRYVTKLTAASHSFYCDSTAFVVVSPSQNLKLISREIIFEVFQPT